MWPYLVIIAMATSYCPLFFASVWSGRTILTSHDRQISVYHGPFFAAERTVPILPFCQPVAADDVRNCDDVAGITMTFKSTAKVLSVSDGPTWPFTASYIKRLNEFVAKAQHGDDQVITLRYVTRPFRWTDLFGILLPLCLMLLGIRGIVRRET